MPEAAQVRPSPEGVPGAVTDPRAVRGENVTFPGAGDTGVNGYLATPATSAEGASRPAIVVIHEAGGLGEHIRDVTNRFANLGYTALGVDLYTREGGPPPMNDPGAVMERIFSIPDERAVGDLEGAAALVLGREDASGRLGCIGFCMGGRYTLLFACTSERLDAAVDCWGGFIDKATLEERSTPERPTPPLELVDQNPSPELGERLRERASNSPIGRSGREIKVDVYEGAGHAFFADYRPSYRPAPAAKLWAEIVPFFARHLGSPR